MGLTVSELLERLTAYELQEWMAYFQSDPFGEQRADLRMGILASTVANKPVFGMKRAKRFQPKDFIPEFGSKTAKARGNWRRDLEALKSFSMIHNAKVQMGQKADAKSKDHKSKDHN